MINQKITINFEVEKNGRTFLFIVSDGTPVADAFDVCKELMISFSNMNEKKEDEAIPVETEIAEEVKEV
jgi:hypothetical protein